MTAWLVFAAIAAVAVAFAVAPLVFARGARLAAVVIAAAVAVTGVGLYTVVGRPKLAERTFQSPEEQDVPGLIATLAGRVRERPNDLQGWLLLGRGYFSLGATGEAAKALARAIALAKAQRLPPAQLAPILADYGVAASQAAGTVTRDAEEAFTESLAADPKGPSARFYLGIAAAERGDNAKAERLWQALLADTPADAPYRAEIVDRLAALKAEAVARGGGAPDVRAMVEGLAARLAANGNDLEGWQRLIRAYAVLGERDKARAALARARTVFAQDAGALSTLAATARENGID